MKKAEGDCCDKTQQHPDHQKEISRLNRVAGQVEGIKKMIDERRYCPDIITQLRAIRSAVNSIEANILETHLDACVNAAIKSGSEKERKQKMAELKELYRKYNG